MFEGRHLGFFMQAKTGESTKCPKVGVLGVNSAQLTKATLKLLLVDWVE